MEQRGKDMLNLKHTEYNRNKRNQGLGNWHGLHKISSPHIWLEEYTSMRKHWMWKRAGSSKKRFRIQLFAV